MSRKNPRLLGKAMKRPPEAPEGSEVYKWKSGPFEVEILPSGDSGVAFKIWISVFDTAVANDWRNTVDEGAAWAERKLKQLLRALGGVPR